MTPASEPTMGAFEAMTHFSEVLSRVERGETITITRHGRTIARIVPVENGNRDKARAAIERMKARRQSIERAPIDDLIRTTHEGHRYP